MTQPDTIRTDAPPAADPARGLLEGAAFVLLCLWTRTSPVRLRDQLSPEAGACATLGF
ncbi:hypothetical protein MKK69_28395 [Methylobacterium sp. J-026]|uniref:hypothetical protein n=1 Tax=Methylobacterium sp. J-026 TaxID=2836624 RepID=UPI001FBA8D87|nr:hypothetical protein [Methylobacterium sp. J-026]MCJ2137921.1 hypothetical protein [Methylobacterium sp. J-026]